MAIARANSVDVVNGSKIKVNLVLETIGL